MMIVEVPYAESLYQAELYDTWDVDETEIVLPYYALSEDVRKYILFTDGTRFLARLLRKRRQYLITNVGTFDKFDYICICRAKRKYTMCSGLYARDEHIRVRRPSPREREIAEEFINGTYTKKLPNRVKLMLINKLKEHMCALNITEKWVIERLIREADNLKGRGADRLEAIKILARIGGVEVGSPGTAGPRPLALFQQNNYGETIQDIRRRELPTQQTLAKMIELAGIKPDNSTNRDENGE